MLHFAGGTIGPVCTRCSSWVGGGLQRVGSYENRCCIGCCCSLGHPFWVSASTHKLTLSSSLHHFLMRTKAISLLKCLSIKSFRRDIWMFQRGCSILRRELCTTWWQLAGLAEWQLQITHERSGGGAKGLQFAECSEWWSIKQTVQRTKWIFGSS